eukprot:54685_1
MSFFCDKATKAEMRIEMDNAIDTFMFNKFRHSIPLHKTTHECMAQCYDKHRKPKPIWECLTNCQRTYKNAQGYLGSLVTEFLNEPSSECLKESVGSTQEWANEKYTKCVRDQIQVFHKVRNQCMGPPKRY